MKVSLKIAAVWLAIVASAMSGCGAQAETTAAPPLPTVAPTPTIEPAATQPPAPTLTPKSETCADNQGRIVLETLTSQVTGKSLRYRVYLPPCYNATGRRYPLLVMLHGYIADSDVMNDDQWVRLGLVSAADRGYAEGTLPPVVIVMPNGLDASYGLDDGPFGKVVASELIPEVKSKFCLWDDPARRAIGGLSRGGYWAFSIAFLNPGLFGKVGGHSPFVYAGDYPNQNPTNLLDTPLDLKGLSIYVDHGVEDYVAGGAREMVDKLKARGIQPQYVVNRVGKHTEDYWSAHVSEYLAFYAADWPKDASLYPACGPVS